MNLKKRPFLLVFLLMLGSLAAQAQLTATVGVPYTYDILAAIGVAPTLQSGAYTVTISIAANAGTVPPGIAISSAGIVTVSPPLPEPIPSMSTL
jgi:hypothetical protein